ncbi:MAG: NAD-binding protein, partial [Xenococcaceae cyanobacterium]
PPLPQRDHIIIVGMGKTGQKVKVLLEKFHQQLAIITFEPSFYQQYAPKMPLVTGNIETALTTVNLSQAQSIIIVTDYEILNLETALMAKKISPQLNIVLKTSGKCYFL